MRKEHDLTGKRFGRLTVIKLGDSNKQGRRWLCQCDCGNKKLVYGKNLKRGVKSCGCKRGPAQMHYNTLSTPCFEDSGLLGLRAAILSQASADYRDGNQYEKQLLEEWFLSEWGQFLSNDMGEIIIERLKKGE
jgi:hypothetical protein